MTISRARASRGLEVDIIQDLADAEALAPQWSGLSDRRGSGPFSTPAFALAWWRHLGRGRLLLAAARNGGGQLVGVAPLHERRLGPVGFARWLGHGLGAIGLVMTDDTKADVAGTLWSALADANRVLDLTDSRLGTVGVGSLRQSHEWQLHATLRDRCPTITVGGLDSVDDFLAVPARRGIRKKLAKTDRTLERDGRTLAIERVSHPDRLHDALPRLQSVYDAAEKAYPRLHLLKAPYRGFLLDAFAQAAGRGDLTILIAHLDDRPVAFDVYVRTGTVAHAWLGRFDPVARDYSPGHLLLRAGVDWAIGEGIDLVDLQLGTDEYKRRWADDGYDTLRIVGAADRTRLGAGRAALAALDAGFDLRRRVRQLG